MTQNELTRDELRNHVFWLVTLLHSALGTCNRLRTASSAEKDKRLVGIGYNGSLPGQPHCDEVGHLIINGHCERTRHGETNLGLNTDRDKFKGCRVRIIGTPCLRCLRDTLISLGAKEIFYAGEYPNSTGKEYIFDLAEKSGVKLEHVDIDWVEVLQLILDKLAEPGGVFYNQGFRIKLIKEPLIKGG